MGRILAGCGCAAAVCCAPASSATLSTAELGQSAPAFSAPDLRGVTHRLSDYAGRWVVLEWYDPECPYTRKHYDSGNLPRLEQKWTTQGVVWLTVYTAGAPTDEQQETAGRDNHAASAVLLDRRGTVARAYEAKTALHTFVIDPHGTLVYNGAIDDRPTTDVADIKGAHNYVDAALTEGMAGRAISVRASRPYGCAVRYPSVP
jgi:peroxiredoxin